MFAARIRSIRNTLGLSQHAFGRKLGYSKSQILRWENGDSMPPSHTLDDIASKLEVTPSYLLGLVDGEKDEISEDDLTPVEMLMLAVDRLRDVTHAVQKAIDLIRSDDVDK